MKKGIDSPVFNLIHFLENANVILKTTLEEQNHVRVIEVLQQKIEELKSNSL